MSVTANLTTNVETITATIVVEDETIIAQVNTAPRGPAGEAGAAGPNAVTTATTTNLTGFISGNGTNIAGATAAATAATANTLVLRSATGGASFGPLSALAGSSNQHSITSSAGTNIVGPLALSGSTGDTLTATYNAAITLNSTTGVNVNGGPLTLTQTWNDAAVTYTGLQVNVTDTASNAASLLADFQVGGSSRFAIGKTGFTFRAATIFAGISSDGSGRILLNSSTAGGVRVSGDLQIGLSDTVLLRDGASGTLAQRNGTAQQESRIYGTYTSAGNYRRLALKMDTAGVAQIVAEGHGGGASGNRLEFVTGGATRMTVAADGNVGIGTTSPASKLDVVGAIKASATVQTGGYTFATLPTPSQGMRTFITDGAAIPIFMANASGGGPTVAPVFYNGSNWIYA
jgi:hypothetical protein